MVPMLGLDRPQVLAGEFKTQDGTCVVWLNLRAHWWPSRICNTATHEVRHLHGDRHPIPRDRRCRR